MPDATMESIGRRLDRLERANRTLKRRGGLLMAVTAAALACGAVTVIDDKLVVRDATGRGRVIAGVNPADIDEAGIEVFDVRGVRRLWMGTDANGIIHMTVFKVDGQIHAELCPP